MSIVDTIYDKIMVKGKKLEKKDKIGAKIYVTKLIAKNFRLIMKARSIQKKTYNNLCEDCHEKIDKRDVTLSVKEHYDLINNKHFCDKCTPYIKEYTDFMTKIKISDVKI